MTDLNLQRLKSFAQLDFERDYATVTTPRKDFLTLLAHVENLEAAIQRVRDLHSRVDVWNECAVCTEHAEALPYPCPTIQALGDQK